MPLYRSRSKKAFSHNVKAEMAAGKPQKQAVAIAYSEKREAKGGHTDHDAHQKDAHERMHAALKHKKEGM